MSAQHGASHVADILDRRHHLATFEERVGYAMALARQHLQEENPSEIEHAMRLYTEDVVWEVPNRRIKYFGREAVKTNYLRLFGAVENIRFEEIDMYATPDRVFHDMWARFRLIGEGIENAPVPIGTKVKMRLVHSFHIRDGLVSREIGYESWLIDQD